MPALEAGLDRYVAEVMRFRRALNLTSVDDRRAFMARFIEPSLALLAWVPDRGRLLDLGSGMGIPGVPMLLARSELHGLLVERRRKRAEFLRHLVRTLDLDAEVFAEDIERIPPLAADAAVARAVADQVRLLLMLKRHVRPGGLAVFPVPTASERVRVEGWRCERDRRIMPGQRQRVRVYRRMPDQEGFT